jgi:hypothetical protein
MPRTGWTPSIVPKGDDQNVYLVIDDLGRNGRVYPETDVETADLETASTGIPSASSPSTPSKAGRRMYPPISPKDFVAVAICRCATCHHRFRILSRGTRASIVR